ncbi:hypothetical protein K2D_20380 [Planctomycetes bacterium K2D]|uniref:Uncharacterized protein n=1 Tax=Botrimarina mediterranea TaxID=2528022 RepID=A0A518K7N0_9BACT|nr:hypothetical protein Spa11_19840 [Botrimarina mediterranea]QDV78431.1 hypothetical protein K2D_20380 [Planctomycetes bacterium K2D]
MKCIAFFLNSDVVAGRLCVLHSYTYLVNEILHALWTAATKSDNCWKEGFGFFFQSDPFDIDSPGKLMRIVVGQEYRRQHGQRQIDGQE